MRFGVGLSWSRRSLGQAVAVASARRLVPDLVLRAGGRGGGGLGDYDRFAGVFAVVVLTTGSCALTCVDDRVRRSRSGLLGFVAAAAAEDGCAQRDCRQQREGTA